MLREPIIECTRKKSLLDVADITPYDRTSFYRTVYSESRGERFNSESENSSDGDSAPVTVQILRGPFLLSDWSSFVSLNSYQLLHWKFLY